MISLYKSTYLNLLGLTFKLQRLSSCVLSAFIKRVLCMSCYTRPPTMPLRNITPFFIFRFSFPFIFILNLFALISRLCTAKVRNLLCLGDFNWPNIDWSTWTPSSKSGSEFQFIDTCLLYTSPSPRD